MGNISKAELKRRLAQQRRDLQAKLPITEKTEYVQGELVQGKGMLVYNWKEGWKWFSSWAFLLILFIATVPIPSEFLALLPEHVREMVIGVVAVAGWILRFINQTKSTPLVSEEGV